jgi:hypothetical protein
MNAMMLVLLAEIVKPIAMDEGACETGQENDRRRK